MTVESQGPMPEPSQAEADQWRADFYRLQQRYNDLLRAHRGTLDRLAAREDDLRRLHRRSWWERLARRGEQR